MAAVVRRGFKLCFGFLIDDLNTGLGYDCALRIENLPRNARGLRVGTKSPEQNNKGHKESHILTVHIGKVLWI